MESGLKSTASNQIPVVNAEQIVTALRAHPNLIDPARLPLFVREARKQGIDIAEVNKALERAMVRRHLETQTPMAQKWLGDLMAGVQVPGRKYGNVEIKPEGSGYAVTRPGASTVHPRALSWRNLWGAWDPYKDVIPTTQKETMDRMLRENETVLAPLLEALNRGP
jgi:hypothetical protein